MTRSEVSEGAADSNRDGKVTADEIYAYVSEQVAKATNGAQRPVHFGRLSPDAIYFLPPPHPRFHAHGPSQSSWHLPESFAPGYWHSPGPPLPKLRLHRFRVNATALADDGQKILVQYLSGEETPPPRADFDRGADLFRRAYALILRPSGWRACCFFVGVPQLFEARRPPCPTFRPRWSWSRTALMHTTRWASRCCSGPGVHGRGRSLPRRHCPRPALGLSSLQPGD